MYFYVKALHIIFVVTWFAGLFYVVRLFIYNREANDKPEVERKILQAQFGIMIRRLWYFITWPSCVLSVVFGAWMLVLFGTFPFWLELKLILVGGLLAYHLSLQYVFNQQRKSNFRFTSGQLRWWNEVASLFLISIVFLVELKSAGAWLRVIAIGILIVVFFLLVRVVRGRRG